MFAYVASVTLHEHFMNALNAQNASVNLEKTKDTISVWVLLLLGYFSIFPPCKVLFQIASLPKIKPSQFSSILQLFINLNVHCLIRGPGYFRHFDNFTVVTKFFSCLKIPNTPELVFLVVLLVNCQIKGFVGFQTTHLKGDSEEKLD